MNISDIVILLLPVLFPIVLWLFKAYERSLPENTQKMLETFAKRAVQAIEQMYPDKPNLNKKSQAVVTIQALFRDAKLVPPSQWSIEFAVEAAVYEVKTLIGTQSTAKPVLKISTGVLPSIAPVPPTELTGA